jgi:hypothetical protein
LLLERVHRRRRRRASRNRFQRSANGTSIQNDRVEKLGIRFAKFADRGHENAQNK